MGTRRFLRTGLPARLRPCPPTTITGTVRMIMITTIMIMTIMAATITTMTTITAMATTIITTGRATSATNAT